MPDLTGEISDQYWVVRDHESGGVKFVRMAEWLAMSQKTDEPDMFNLVAQRIHLKPKGWRWFRVQALAEYPGYIVTGAIPRVHKDGRVEWPDEGCDPPLLITFQQIEVVSKGSGVSS